ncbi:MAG: adenylate/guanylate cyclase domain-containing protein [Alphaproteobacteria bacterium]|nr:adenylate/guanylate cyclase domain-containing protein [Alphaproteobacteria bacterium]
MRFNVSKITSFLLLFSSWVLLCVMVASKFAEPPLITDLTYKTFDFYQQFAPRPYKPTGVRIIDIDDASLSKLGQWPWPRQLLADMTQKLTDAGVAAIGFDMIFPEEDRTAPKHILPLWGKQEALSGALGTLPDPDKHFAKTIGKASVVISSMFTKQSYQPHEYDKASVLIRGDLPSESIRRFDGMIGSLPLFTSAAHGSGFINSADENDGVLRWVPLFLSYNQQLYPSLALETLRVAMGAKVYELIGKQSMEAVRVGDLTIPTDKEGMLWIYYSRSVKDRYIPAWKVMDGTFRPEDLAGHIVFIGTSAAGLKDLRTTPLYRALAGVEVHAQAVEQMILQQFLERPDWIFGAEMSLIFILGALLLWMMRHTNAMGGFVCMLMLIGLTLGGSWLAFREAHILIEPVTATITLIVMYAVESLRRFLRSEHERRQVRAAFSLYLSPELVSRAVASPHELTLGGENREITVMFCDIRDFSSYSENMNPQALTTFINHFLTPMSDAILGQSGTIDKYIGDAIMAFWNAPLTDTQHAAHACRAALGMREQLVIFNANLAKTNPELPPVRMGMGLNTGICCVGNLGSKQRFNYSALGNNVDLASRLEGQSKTYGLDLIIGEGTAKQVQDMALLELDLIRVKGKSKALAIYTLLGDEVFAKSAAFQELSTHHAAMISAYRSKDWAKAIAALNAAASLAPTVSSLSLDSVYTLYRQRVARFQFEEPEDAWDGVYTAEEK